MSNFKYQISNPKIVFFGASKFVFPIIESLKENFELALVITTEMLPTDAVPAYCKQNNIPYLALKQFNNATIEQLKSVNAPIAALASFGLLIPNELLNLFPKGILNIHPSLLPKYRGPTPVQTAIKNGDATTGVSIIKLDSELDHGPILAQTDVVIAPDDTADTLHAKLFTLGTTMLVNVIKNNDNIKPKDQNHEKATFTAHLTRQSGYIDLDNPPAKEELQNLIRAYYPWPGVFTKLRIKNKELRIKFLPSKMLQVEGKKPVSVKDFLNGYPETKQLLEQLGLL